MCDFIPAEFKLAACRPKRAYTDGGICLSGILNVLKASTHQHTHPPTRSSKKGSLSLFSRPAGGWVGVLVCARVSSIYPFRDIGLLRSVRRPTFDEGAGQRRASVVAYSGGACSDGSGSDEQWRRQRRRRQRRPWQRGPPQRQALHGSITRLLVACLFAVRRRGSHKDEEQRGDDLGCDWTTSSGSGTAMSG